MIARSVIAVLALGALLPAARADEAACKSLVSLDLSAVPEAPTQLITTAFVAAAKDLPPYCDIRAVVAPQVGVRVRVPDRGWNGKFHFEGCGAMCGIRGIAAADDPLSRGYAVAVSDLGHTAPYDDDGDPNNPATAVIARWGAWAYNNPEAELDLAYRGTHKAVIAAKAIVTAYGGAAPRRSYWRGCSTGGRQALSLAQRYPWHFDGLVAGAPAGMQPAYINMFWRTLANMDRGGRAILGREHLPLVAKTVMAQCDAKDGLADGVINDPWSCKPDLAALKCTGAPGAQCLTPAQIDVVGRLYRGAFLQSGLRVSPGLQPGAELNLAPYIRDKAGANISFETMAIERLRYVWFDYDPGPDYSPRSFELDRDYPKLFTKGLLQAPNNPDLSDFQRRGGKLIVYQGLNDLVDAPPLVDYVEKATRVAGGKAAADEFLRLYLIPGMDHCRGGVGVDTVDWISAMENWVEKNEAPGMLVAARRANGVGPPGAGGFPLDPATVVKTRPIYPFPDVAAYTGDGDPTKAENFRPAPLSYVPLVGMATKAP